MALLYISHADETERRARIQRVKQGIADNAVESSLRITKITNDLDKGKGHVFDYASSADNMSRAKQAKTGISFEGKYRFSPLDDEEESSGTNGDTLSAPVVAHQDFQLGPSFGGRVSTSTNGKKSQRKRPPAWKRRTRQGSLDHRQHLRCLLLRNRA